MPNTETTALRRFVKATEDVERLWSYHPSVSNPGMGRPEGGEHGALLRSSIVLLCAAWEMFVEDLTLWLAGELVKGSSDALPVKFRDFVVRDKVDAWSFVGEGWRSVALQAVEVRVRGDGVNSFGLNTANADKLTKLHLTMFDVDFLGRCRWQGKSVEAVRGTLTDFVSLRGDIAHTGDTPEALHLAGARSWHNFVTRLARALDREVMAWLMVQQGTTSI